MPNPPTFEIVTTRTGARSIRDHVTGEIMHNPVGPWVEANALYVDQSRLRERLRADVSHELVIFDVGLGAAANALATLHAAQGLRDRRPLRLVSFERDLDLLKFALDHADDFDHLQSFQEAVRAILEHGEWSTPGITWQLRHGDFRELILREPLVADLVFYDPYSFKKNSEMWTVETFSKLRARLSSSATLYTYSRATPVRVSLLLAGFYIGVGRSTGLKDETTQAGVRLADLDQPLSLDWLGTWQRSSQPNAAGAHVEDLAVTRGLVPKHPQFSASLQSL